MSDDEPQITHYYTPNVSSIFGQAPRPQLGPPSQTTIPSHQQPHSQSRAPVPQHGVVGRVSIPQQPANSPHQQPHNQSLVPVPQHGVVGRVLMPPQQQNFMSTTPAYRPPILYTYSSNGSVRQSIPSMRYQQPQQPTANSNLQVGIHQLSLPQPIQSHNMASPAYTSGGHNTSYSSQAPHIQPQWYASSMGQCNSNNDESARLTSLQNELMQMAANAAVRSNRLSINNGTVSAVSSTTLRNSPIIKATSTYCQTEPPEKVHKSCQFRSAMSNKVTYYRASRIDESTQTDESGPIMIDRATSPIVIYTGPVRKLTKKRLKLDGDD